MQTTKYRLGEYFNHNNLSHKNIKLPNFHICAEVWYVIKVYVVCIKYTSSNWNSWKPLDMSITVSLNSL